MDLSTPYMGLNLKSPLIPSASTLSDTLDNLRRMEDAGAAAIVLHSLFSRTDCAKIAPSFCIRSRKEPRVTRKPPATYREGPAVLSSGTGALPRSDPKGQGGSENSHHRQPQREFGGRLDRLRQKHPASRGGRPGAQHLFHSHGSDPQRFHGRRAHARHRPGGQVRGILFPWPSNAVPISATWRTWRLN